MLTEEKRKQVEKAQKIGEDTLKVLCGVERKNETLDSPVRITPAFLISMFRNYGNWDAWSILIQGIFAQGYFRKVLGQKKEGRIEQWVEQLDMVLNYQGRLLQAYSEGYAAAVTEPEAKPN
jgi:hypothetical protein